MNAIRKFMKEEDGVTALEYGILAAIVGAVLITAGNTGLKTAITTLFTKISSIVTTATK